MKQVDLEELDKLVKNRWEITYTIQRKHGWVLISDLENKHYVGFGENAIEVINPFRNQPRRSIDRTNKIIDNVRKKIISAYYPDYDIETGDLDQDFPCNGKGIVHVLYTISRKVHNDSRREGHPVSLGGGIGVSFGLKMFESDLEEDGYMLFFDRGCPNCGPFNDKYVRWNSDFELLEKTLEEGKNERFEYGMFWYY